MVSSWGGSRITRTFLVMINVRCYDVPYYVILILILMCREYVEWFLAPRHQHKIIVYTYAFAWSQISPFVVPDENSGWLLPGLIRLWTRISTVMMICTGRVIPGVIRIRTCPKRGPRPWALHISDSLSSRRDFTDLQHLVQIRDSTDSRTKISIRWRILTRF